MRARLLGAAETWQWLAGSSPEGCQARDEAELGIDTSVRLMRKMAASG